MASSSLTSGALPSSAAFALNEATSSRKRAALFGSPDTYCSHMPFSASRRERMSASAGPSQSMSNSMTPPRSAPGNRLSSW